MWPQGRAVGPEVENEGLGPCYRAADFLPPARLAAEARVNCVSVLAIAH